MGKDSDTRVPMIIYSCLWHKDSFCSLGGELPSGAHDSFGSRWCERASSPNREDVNCNQAVIKETPILAYQSKGGMLS